MSILKVVIFYSERSKVPLATLIIFLTGRFVNNMSEKSEKYPTQLSRAQHDVLLFLNLIDRKSKTQIYSVYSALEREKLEICFRRIFASKMLLKYCVPNPGALLTAFVSHLTRFCAAFMFW